ncbi:MAG: hypothetical protein AAF483_02570 [Planctomycetota bacterium]
MTKLIDRESLNQFIADDQDMLDDLASVYIRLAPDDVRALQDASREADFETTAKLAAQLKSRFSCFSAGNLAGIAEELQTLAEQEHLSDADSLVQSVCDGALELINELSEITGNQTESATTS